MKAPRLCRRCRARIAEPARCVNGHAQPDAPYERLAELLAEQIDYDKLAEKVAERLRGFAADLAAPAPEADPGGLVTAAELAKRIGMSTRWIYDHQDELGVIPAGSGRRPRLRFDPARALALLAERNADVSPEPRPKLERRELPGDAPLLPVSGRAA